MMWELVESISCKNFNELQCQVSLINMIIWQKETCGCVFKEDDEDGDDKDVHKEWDKQTQNMTIIFCKTWFTFFG